MFVPVFGKKLAADPFPALFLDEDEDEGKMNALQRKADDKSEMQHSCLRDDDGVGIISKSDCKRWQQ